MLNTLFVQCYRSHDTGPARSISISLSLVLDQPHLLSILSRPAAQLLFHHPIAKSSMYHIRCFP